MSQRGNKKVMHSLSTPTATSSGANLWRTLGKTVHILHRELGHPSNDPIQADCTRFYPNLWGAIPHTLVITNFHRIHEHGSVTTPREKYRPSAQKITPKSRWGWGSFAHLPWKLAATKRPRLTDESRHIAPSRPFEAVRSLPSPYSACPQLPRNRPRWQYPCWQWTR